tara:strand:+ start:5849 stop:6493 length:645 start_codon:yes stop_codon:yes gene_type:complete
MGKVTSLVRKALSLKDPAVIDEEIEWNAVVLNGRVAVVPSRPLTTSTDFKWLEDRLLPLGDGAIVTMAGRSYTVKLPHRQDLKAMKEHVDPDIQFWLRATNPRRGKVGPRKGTYDTLANATDSEIGVLPVLYLCDDKKSKLKAIVSHWLNSLKTVFRKVVRKVGAFARLVWGYAEGFRKKHVRKGHWRAVGDELVWVKECKVRGHYYGESLPVA